MLYRFLKFLMKIGIRSYYKEVKVVGRQFLSHEGPTILIANHPNTLMDALMVGFASKNQIYFMAKGTFFSSKFKSWLLKNLNMIPVNRRGEKAVSGVSNQDSFEACYRLLEQGKTIVIFPEGNSFKERRLRELKLGAAKIALEVEKRNQGKLNLQIIPLGINYQKAEKFRSSVLIQVGKGIMANSYLKEYEKEGNKVAKKLTAVFRLALERQLVSIDTLEQEQLAESLVELLSSRYLQNDGRGVQGKISFLREIQLKLEEVEISKPYQIEEIQGLVLEIKTKLEDFNVPADFLDRRFRLKMFLRQIITSVLILLVGLPLFLFGFIHAITAYKLSDFLVPKITQEVEYFAPIYLLLGLILYPLTFGLFVYFVSPYFDLSTLEKVGYFISMPITALIAYSMKDYLKHVIYKWKFVQLMVNQKDVMDELQRKRSVLRQLLFNE
jgi:1-acyl-sn-glycerol-3-phosphate acyltransferase